MKIVTIIGARPQFIKAAALNRYITKNYSSAIQEILVHTGQHYDQNMSEIFFTEMDIAKPQYNLSIGSGLHGAQTGAMLQNIEEILIKEKPGLVLIYGDTNSTIAGSLAASKLHIPVAHVEAGLRSFNTYMPEEQNRILTDNISQYLFCPTETAINNLKNEGIFHGKKLNMYGPKHLCVINSGDIMYDAILHYQKKNCNIEELLYKLKAKPKDYILATIHRAENTDNKEKLLNIFEAFSKINEKIIIALHPRTKKFLQEYGFKISDNIQIIDPIGYIDMINLEKNAKIIMTDSGGVQKEAYFLKIPCVTLREETEWVETVKDNWNYLVGSDKDKIIHYYNKVIETNYLEKEINNYFGDGNTSKIIIDELIKYS